MSGIQIQTTFGRTDLPVVTPLRDQIAAMPGLALWAQADPAHLTLDGNLITTWGDVAGGANTLHRVSLTSRAEFVGNQIAGYPAARFRGSDDVADGQVDIYSTAATLPDAAPYTLATVFKRTTSTNPDTIIGKFTDASTRVLLNCQNGAENVRLQHGTSTITRAITAGSWNYVLAAFTGSTLLMNVNGVDVPPVAAAGSMGAASVIIGALSGAGSQAFDGWLSDLLIFNADVLSDNGKKTLLTSYFRAEYGL